MNINIRSIFVFVGYLVLFVALLMLIPLIITIFSIGSLRQDLEIWFALVLILGFLGVIILLSSKINVKMNFSAKDTLIITFLSWTIFSLLASLPFYFTSSKLTFINAFFEATSGITTTGASVINNLSEIQPALHVWRIMLGWIGSVGIIVTAVIVFPTTQSGSKLFKTEAFETFDNTLDKAKKLAMGVLVLYSVLTLLSFFALLYFGNLNVLDAFIHAASSTSATGFSNKEASAGEFNNTVVYIILSLSMLSSGIPYVFLYYLVFHRRLTLLRDEQVRGYIKIIFFSIVIIALWLIFKENRNITETIMPLIFTVISLITGTGLTVIDYTTFGFLPCAIFLILMIIGGCAGSKTAGLKIYRVQMAFIFIKNTLIKLYLPKHIRIPIYNGKEISSEIANAILVYIVLYFAVVFIITTLIAGTGLDFNTSFTATVAAVSNVGPAFGDIIGPNGNYYTLSSFAKIVLCCGMLLGRLEIFVIIAIFTPRFWRA